MIKTLSEPWKFNTMIVSIPIQFIRNGGGSWKKSPTKSIWRLLKYSLQCLECFNKNWIYSRTLALIMGNSSKLSLYLHILCFLLQYKNVHQLLSDATILHRTISHFQFMPIYIVLSITVTGELHYVTSIIFTELFTNTSALILGSIVDRNTTRIEWISSQTRSCRACVAIASICVFPFGFKRFLGSFATWG